VHYDTPPFLYGFLRSLEKQVFDRKFYFGEVLNKLHRDEPI
jgi:hypothetical protein